LQTPENQDVFCRRNHYTYAEEKIAAENVIASEAKPFPFVWV
jgi:hypothetical protein